MAISHENQPITAIINIDQQDDRTLRSATRDMIVRNLADIDPTAAQPWNSEDMIKRAAVVSDFEQELLNPDNTPREAKALARDGERRYYSPIERRSNSVTMFHNQAPILYAGFCDEWYNDEWADYYDGDGEPTPKDEYRRPEIQYMIGEAAVLSANDTVTQAAITAVYAIIERRQHVTAFDLTKYHSSKWYLNSEQTLNSLYLFGTIPYLSYLGAMARLSTQLAAQPESVIGVVSETEKNDVYTIPLVA